MFGLVVAVVLVNLCFIITCVSEYAIQRDQKFEENWFLKNDEEYEIEEEELEDYEEEVDEDENEEEVENEEDKVENEVENEEEEVEQVEEDKEEFEVLNKEKVE